MATFTSVATVSYRYYEKRNRSVAELNVKQMCHSLERASPEGLSAMPKHDLIMLALHLHGEMPE